MPESEPINSYSELYSTPSLLEGLRNQEADAWDRLYKIWKPLIYNYCIQPKRKLGPDDAEEITQAVLLRIFRGIAGFKRDGAGKRFRYWVWAIVRNEMIDFYKQKSKTQDAIGGSDFQAILESQPAFDEKDIEEHFSPQQILLQAMDLIKPTIKPHNWEAFELNYRDSLSYSEISEVQEREPKAVKQAVNRVRTLLKKMLEGQLD